jgi:phosphomannomutase/phosphoglucomutase
VSAAPAASLFKAYDIRGVAGRELTAEAMAAIACAFGSEARDGGFGRVALGRDGRLSSPELFAAACAGLRAAGVEVCDVGLVPSPLLYFAAHRVADGCGMMITGSHNPPGYNGAKLMLGGESLAGERVKALHRRLQRNDLRTGSGGMRAAAVADEYLARVRADVSPARPLRVVVDSGNGAAGPFAGPLLASLGCEVHPLFAEVDGRFPHHHPDPSEPENLRHLSAAVASLDAHLGLAFDGDGDRLGVVIPGGEVIWPDRLMILFARDLLARHPGAEVVFDVKCSGHLARAIRAAGGRPVIWRTGHSMIKTRMRESGALLGGELTGHFFFADRWFGFDDALYAAARLVQLLAGGEGSPAEQLSALPRGVATPELRLPLPEEAVAALMARVLERAPLLGGEPLDLDGLRVDYPDGWGLVRASHTVPSLVFRFEGDDEAALSVVQARFGALLLDLEPSLALPF